MNPQQQGDTRQTNAFFIPDFSLQSTAAVTGYYLRLVHTDLSHQNIAAEALDVNNYGDLEQYFETFVKPKEWRIRQWSKSRDEVAAARSTQLGALLYEDMFKVLELFLQPNCAIEEELEELAISTVADGCEKEWLLRAYHVDATYQTASYFLTAVKHILVRAQKWTPYLLRCRIGQPSLVARLIVANALIPEDVGDDFFAKQSTDNITPVFGCVAVDAKREGMAVLRTVKSRMLPHVFESQICHLGSSGNLAIHIAIVRFAKNNRALDLEYLRLLVPSDFGAINFNEDTFKESLMDKTTEDYANANEEIWNKSIEVIEELTGNLYDNTC